MWLRLASASACSNPLPQIPEHWDYKHGPDNLTSEDLLEEVKDQSLANLYWNKNINHIQ